MPLSLSLFFFGICSHSTMKYVRVVIELLRDKSRSLHFSQFPTVPSTVLDKMIEQLQDWFEKYGPYLIYSMFSFSLACHPSPYTQ